MLELLRRHLPTGMAAGRGFVIDPDDETACSREQDILVVDCSVEPPVFSQAGVLITFPRSVRAAVSVKTVCKKETMYECVENLNSVRSLASRWQSPAVWCGAYYFGPSPTVATDPTKPLEYVLGAAAQHPVPPSAVSAPHPSLQGPDLHCVGRDLAYRMIRPYSEAVGRLIPSAVLGYRCPGLATALFLGSLLDHLVRSTDASGSDFITFVDGDGFEPIGRRECSPPPGVSGQA